jgi:hypothetical protein
MDSNARYDMLEVLVLHARGSDPAATLAFLQESVEPRFEVEPLEHVGTHGVGALSQTVRIASTMGEAFESASSFDAELRELVGAGFTWKPVGAIRTGRAATV